MDWLGPPTNMGMPPLALFGKGSKAAHARKERVTGILVANAERHLGATACRPDSAAPPEQPGGIRVADLDGEETSVGSTSTILPLGGVDEAEALRALLAAALPGVETGRLEQLITELMEERLTVKSLRSAAGSGGAAFAFTALDLESLGLKRGEKLELVSVLMQ